MRDLQFEVDFERHISFTLKIFGQKPAERKSPRKFFFHITKNGKVLIDIVILAIKLNISLNSAKEINSHGLKYVQIPESWRSKKYALELVEYIYKRSSSE